MCARTAQYALNQLRSPEVCAKLNAFGALVGCDAETQARHRPHLCRCHRRRSDRPADGWTRRGGAASARAPESLHCLSFAAGRAGETAHEAVRIPRDLPPSAPRLPPCRATQAAIELETSQRAEGGEKSAAALVAGMGALGVGVVELKASGGGKVARVKSKMTKKASDTRAGAVAKFQAVRQAAHPPPSRRRLGGPPLCRSGHPWVPSGYHRTGYAFFLNRVRRAREQAATTVPSATRA